MIRVDRAAADSELLQCCHDALGGRWLDPRPHLEILDVVRGFTRR
jgi:hypothetical protein